MPLSQRRWSPFLGVLALAIGVSTAQAQGLTSGSLSGIVVSVDGAPIGGVQVTLERGPGSTFRSFETLDRGTFRFSTLPSGQYSLLIEQIGYQPVRRTHVWVAAGQRTSVSVVLVRRPPPITAVEEQLETARPSGIDRTRLFASEEIEVLPRRRDASDVSAEMTDVVAPFDGRPGFALSTGGVRASLGRFAVDGVQETMLSHLGFPDQPARTPIFARDGVEQIGLLAVPIDAEWRGSAGGHLVAESRRGTNRFRFAPYATFSTEKLGGKALDNPTDSAATSFQIGASLSGAIVPDTALFALRFDYQSLLEASPYAWERDRGLLAGQDVSLRETLPTIAGVDGSLIAPPVRSWKGGSGSGRVDWQIAARHRLAVRAGFASWKERAFNLGDELVSGAGSELSARDGSGAVTLTTGGGNVATNDLRAGFSMARREYGGTGAIATSIVANGAAFGRSLGGPALFDRKTFDLSDAIQVRLGEHAFKAGASLSFVSHVLDYRYGSAGAFAFGDLAHFAAKNGTFFVVEGPTEQARFKTNEIGFFLEDTWNVSPEIQLLVGGRMDNRKLPNVQIARNTAWQTYTGEFNDIAATSKMTFSPRLGFIWDLQNRGDWIVRGGGGRYADPFDPAPIAEALLFDREVFVRRSAGSLAGWPALPTAADAALAGQRMTILSPTFRAPTSTKADFGITRNFAGGSLQVSGSYQHSDYLLRRENRNRLTTATGTTQEGRPLYGTLVQSGGLLYPSIGSNRRFSEFDLVSGLTPTGFSDYYEATIVLDRRLAGPLGLNLAYTYSKTTDNLVGARSADPTDQLSPFPELDDASWVEGRSDFDVPHRAAATLRLVTGERMPIALTARYRIRSGLPFTPGFRPGVDANADGSGNNDPAFLGGTVAGLSEALAGGRCSGSLSENFAERNSCREKMQQGLDLGISIGLPFGAHGNRVALTIDAFNLVTTETGIVDRALVLVDPSGAITPGSSGNVTVPLIANPEFGSLLIRRGEPRVIRVGLKLEY